MAKNIKRSSSPALAGLILALVLGGLIIVPELTHAATRSSKASITFTDIPSVSVEVGQSQMVSYATHNYKPSTVTVNLIRKVASNPNRYELVRTVAADKPNDGSVTWVPAKTDVGTGLSLEIACAPSKSACTAAESTNSPLAVVDTGRFSYTASIWNAIERFMNF